VPSRGALSSGCHPHGSSEATSLAITIAPQEGQQQPAYRRFIRRDDRRRAKCRRRCKAWLKLGSWDNPEFAAALVLLQRSRQRPPANLGRSPALLMRSLLQVAMHLLRQMEIERDHHAHEHVCMPMARQRTHCCPHYRQLYPRSALRYL
jgi:hypothetical protein